MSLQWNYVPIYYLHKSKRNKYFLKTFKQKKAYSKYILGILTLFHSVLGLIVYKHIINLCPISFLQRFGHNFWIENFNSYNKNKVILIRGTWKCTSMTPKHTQTSNTNNWYLKTGDSYTYLNGPPLIFNN